MLFGAIAIKLLQFTSRCPRVTDAALEYIACDLNNLEELTLDRLDMSYLSYSALNDFY